MDETDKRPSNKDLDVITSDDGNRSMVDGSENIQEVNLLMKNCSENKKENASALTDANTVKSNGFVSGVKEMDKNISEFSNSDMQTSNTESMLQDVTPACLEQEIINDNANDAANGEIKNKLDENNEGSDFKSAHLTENINESNSVIQRNEKSIEENITKKDENNEGSDSMSAHLTENINESNSVIQGNEKSIEENITEKDENNEGSDSKSAHLTENVNESNSVIQGNEKSIEENITEKDENNEGSDSKSAHLAENVNESNSVIQGNEKSIEENITEKDEERNSGVINFFESDADMELNNEIVNECGSELNSISENNPIHENINSQESPDESNELEINLPPSKDKDDTGEPGELGEMKFVSVSENQNESSSNILEDESQSRIEISKTDLNENLKENENINGSSKLDAPMELDIKDDNPLAEQINERDEEDVLSFKNSSSLDNKESDDNDCCTLESQKSDDASPELEMGQKESSELSPNKFDNSDEVELQKNDEKNELLTTEIINCNDDSQMELCENAKDAEVNNIDTDPCEDEGKKTVEDAEEMDVDKSESFDKDEGKKGDNMKNQFIIEESQPEKQIISVDDGDGLIQPGGSEEETITGDTSHEGPISDTRGKDAELCIIPDDVTPKLPNISEKDKIDQREAKSVDNVRKEEVKILKVIEIHKGNKIEKLKEKECADGVDAGDGDGNENGNGNQNNDNDNADFNVNINDNDEDEDDDNSQDDNGKVRPVRVAAKVAGNKIKSLVESDIPADADLPKALNDEGEKREESACSQCGVVKLCKFEVVQGDRTNPLCSDYCYSRFVKGIRAEVLGVEPGTYTRKCSQCRLIIVGDDCTLSWETMDFCNVDCLWKYQTELGSHCANCKASVASASLGKYCVRFGYDVKQFCSSSCLEEFKKGLKVCSYCQKDISTGTEGFLAPVGDKGHFKDFCTQFCMEKYEQMSNNSPPPNIIAECAVCSNSKPVKVEVQLENKVQKLCSEPCFAAFKFVNNIAEGQCDMCKKYFDRLKTGHFSIYYDDSRHTFCGKTCMNVFILANRKIVPCNWCKVKKYNFDMIKKVSVTGQIFMMCSLNCLALYEVSVNAVSTRHTKCDFCLNFAQAKYHLTMSDGTVRNFCGYACVMSFQNQYPKQSVSLATTEHLTSPFPTGGPKKILPRRSQVGTPGVPVISSVQSLASQNGHVGTARVSIPANEMSIAQVASLPQPITIQPAVASKPTHSSPQVYQQIITKPAPVKQQKNKSILCKPYSHTKGVSCRPHPCMKETQTDESLNRKFLIPIPVPIYVPAPMHMFATPFPVPVPFPLPIPVPIFIPTTRNSAKGIFKEIKKIQEKIPTDPFEAELLMMAEMVAGEKKQDATDSESDEGNGGDDGGDGSFSPENVDTSNTFGEDMLQMALKMATELEEPAVDMESVLASNTITPTSQPTVDPSKGLYGTDPDDPDQVQVMPVNRGRKRSMRGGRNSAGGSQSKRGRRISGSNVDVPILPPPEPVPPPRIEVEKPDANMCLKYTFGVNAWRHWVMQKNAELEKAALTNRKIKLFKPELLQLTADELNFSLCLFVKEVRKPNGAEYAPDTIYYLCLGIQQYLFENGRIDNIFTDSYYEKFTDCLDEVAKKFATLYNDSQYIVTRVEEEHLWESKQLGAHSPHVLLSTLMFFNTKHFNLVTVEEHMQLSFSHIMKHWKRNPNAPGVAKVPGSRNVLLRFYPPQSALEANSRKKKVYEQQENEENPLRCPVKLYEFYLSKCPESVKTRNDVFYLLPERSCVPDSPVWYSTMALGKEPLTKMLHRVKMVKEINIALLTC